ncbi:MAG: ABC transporter permease [Bryobacteraceae bacterium]
MRLQLFEGFAIGVLGAAGGAAVAHAILSAVLPLASTKLPRLAQAAVDARVLGFAAAAAVATSLAASLTPVLRGIGAGADLREGTVARAGNRARRVLVVVQVALGMILLVAAQVLWGGLLEQMRSAPGIRTDNLLTFAIGSGGAAEGGLSLAERLVDRLRATPGVTSTAAGRPLPLEGQQMSVAFDIKGRESTAAERPRSDAAIVTPGFFGTLGIPVLRGRDFDERDRVDSAPVVVVNEAFARRFFPGEDAIGKRIRPGAGPAPVPMREIIGVVGDARQSAVGREMDPVYYFPHRQLAWGVNTIAVRTAGEPGRLLPAVGAALRELDAGAAIHRVRTGEQLAAAALTESRLMTAVMSGFAATALLLAVAGLYGVVSYAVERRRREIGMRIAVGARRADIIGLVLSDAGRLVGVGLALGVAGAIATGRVLQAVAGGGLPAVGADSLAGAAAAFGAASAAAAYLPAEKAAAVNPAKSLRAE